MKPFSAIPFFRLLIPLVAGIFFALSNGAEEASILWPGLTLGLSVAFFLMRDINWRMKYGFMACVDLFLFFTGGTLTAQTNEVNKARHYKHYAITDSVFTWQAAVNDIPVQKNRFLKCELLVRALKLDGKFVPACGKVLAYFRNSSVAGTVKPGQLLLIQAAFAEIQAPLNPGEFDYRQYLSDRQIFASAFVDSNAFLPVSALGGVNRVKAWALNTKLNVLNRLRSSGLSENAFAICSALLTGYDDEIGQSVTEAFSHSGTLHVLSVSGLHTGMIYLVLNFIMSVFDRNNRFKWIRFLIVNTMLWTFALLTGFSAPVLRAVIMFSFFSAGRLRKRTGESEPMNILAASAFLLLLYNPFYVRDVGFILSFSALGGILYFQPGLAGLWRPSGYLVNQIWRSATASVAATIATLPVTLFYFKQFPYWFVVCNLVVVPLSFVLLMMALLIVLKAGFLVGPANWMIKILSAFIGFFDSPTWGYASAVDFSAPDFVFLSIVIILLTVAIQLRHSLLFTVSLFVVVFWQMVSLIFSIETKNKSLMVVSHMRKQEGIMIKNRDKVYLYCTDAGSQNYYLHNQLISFNYPEIKELNFNYAKTGNANFVLLNKKNTRPDTTFDDVNTIIIGNNYRLGTNDLAAFPDLKLVIADGSNSRYSLRRTEELCRKFAIAFYSTAKSGAYIKETHETTDRRQSQVFE